jgi:hypothetical protein
MSEIDCVVQFPTFFCGNEMFVICNAVGLVL